MLGLVLLTFILAWVYPVPQLNMNCQVLLKGFPERRVTRKGLLPKIKVPLAFSVIRPAGLHTLAVALRLNEQRPDLLFRERLIVVSHGFSPERCAKHLFSRMADDLLCCNVVGFSLSVPFGASFFFLSPYQTVLLARKTLHDQFRSGKAY